MMGTWRKKILEKGLRASRTHAGKARKYLAIPPATGWKGGEPSNNGYKRGAR